MQVDQVKGIGLAQPGCQRHDNSPIGQGIKGFAETGDDRKTGVEDLQAIDYLMGGNCIVIPVPGQTATARKPGDGVDHLDFMILTYSLKTVMDKDSVMGVLGIRI